MAEKLLLYTDGMTEAEDQTGTQFSEQGCIDCLHRAGASPLALLLDALYLRVVAHTRTTHPADDCTMLAVRRQAANR